MLLKDLRNTSGNHDIPNMAVFSRDLVGQIILLDGWYEKLFLGVLANIIFPEIPNKSIALDIGANIGNHSIWMSRYFEQVHSFEPHPRTFLLLKVNSKLSPNITVYNVGCSNQFLFNQKATAPNWNLGGAKLLKGLNSLEVEEGDASFDLVRLDDYLPNRMHENVGFIKCDVEGHELEVFQGAKKILKSSMPIIAFEVNKFIAVKRLLSSIGYSNFYGLHRIRRLKSFLTPNKFWKFQPICGDNLSTVNLGMVFASTKKIDLPIKSFEEFGHKIS